MKKTKTKKLEGETNVDLVFLVYMDKPYLVSKGYNFEKQLITLCKKYGLVYRIEDKEGNFLK